MATKTKPNSTPTISELLERARTDKGLSQRAIRGVF